MNEWSCCLATDSWRPLSINAKKLWTSGSVQIWFSIFNTEEWLVLPTDPKTCRWDVLVFYDDEIQAGWMDGERTCQNVSITLGVKIFYNTSTKLSAIWNASTRSEKATTHSRPVLLLPPLLLFIGRCALTKPPKDQIDGRQPIKCLILSFRAVPSFVVASQKTPYRVQTKTSLFSRLPGLIEGQRGTITMMLWTEKKY